MLIVWEMANNHDGSLEKACRIVDALAPIKKEYDKFYFAIKLQRRDIDTFIHPDFKTDYNVANVKRFMDTRMQNEDFLKLCSYIKERGFMLGITPFDENSVDFIKQCNVDFVKVASCCANEWGLLDRISDWDKLIIASTGGLNWDEIDNLYNFLKHKGSNFSLLHCCGIYPAPPRYMNLDVISKMKRRYDVPIGFSDHSSAGTMDAARIAVGKGAGIIERHIKLDQGNSYSIIPDEAKIYVEFIDMAMQYCGDDLKNIPEEERESLRALKRGVWASKDVSKGSDIKHGDIFFAFPNHRNQLLAEEYGAYRSHVSASVDYKKNDPILDHDDSKDKIRLVRLYFHQAKGMMAEAGIVLNSKCTAELCHHYGFDKFKEYGAVIVDVINRQYCKKYIIMLPNQKYLNHVHHSKEETFRVLFGNLTVKLEDDIHELKKGDDILVDRYRAHEFWTDDKGAIFEEISTTHVVGDSYYKDTEVYKLDPMERKTSIEKL
jgi:N-acetylneuraminate synthase